MSITQPKIFAVISFLISIFITVCLSIWIIKSSTIDLLTIISLTLVLLSDAVSFAGLVDTLVRESIEQIHSKLIEEMNAMLTLVEKR